ncbi:MAG TPA: hypothetical protein VIU45_00425 [Chitinophagaceae bacterium]
MLVEDLDGKLEREPRAQTMELFEPLFEAFLDLYIIFDNSFLIGGGGFMNSCDFCLKLHLSFHRVEAFVNELKAEYEVFKLMTAGERGS